MLEGKTRIPPVDVETLPDDLRETLEEQRVGERVLALQPGVPHPIARVLEAHPSQRVRTDDFPAVALAELLAFSVVHRPGRTLQELFDVAAGGGRGVEKQDAAGFAAGALPGMRDVAREEGARAGPADAHLVTDLEGDLTGEHPGDLVAVAV